MFTTIIGISIIIVFVAILIFASYVKAPSDQAYIITGLRKEPKIRIGRAGLRIPFLQRLDKLALGVVQIDVKTSSAVPTAEYINVKVDSNVNVAIGKSAEEIKLASKHFLNVKKEVIRDKVRDLLEGNIREIVGQMKLTEMVSDRKAFSEKVQENAVPDLARFGLELISFNVQNFIDDSGVIENLGVDNVEQIRKAALIAKSDAQREVAIAEANNKKEANEAAVRAAEDIAIKNNALNIKKAELKKAEDTQNAIAETAFSIELENQRKVKDVASTNADIARVERETELKRQEIELKEKELDALVRKEADAKKYAAEQEAEAQLIRDQRAAEADKYEAERKAEARKAQAEADRYEIEQRAEAKKAEADAVKYAALAEAEGIAAVGAAEAEAIAKKAEAQKLMSDASIIDIVMSTLPQIVANASAPLTNVDSITMYGDNNSSKLVGDVMKSTNQITEAIKGATGLDITSLIEKFLNKDNQ